MRDPQGRHLGSTDGQASPARHDGIPAVNSQQGCPSEPQDRHPPSFPLLQLAPEAVHVPKKFPPQHGWSTPPHCAPAAVVHDPAMQMSRPSWQSWPGATQVRPRLEGMQHPPFSAIVDAAAKLAGISARRGVRRNRGVRKRARCPVGLALAAPVRGGGGAVHDGEPLAVVQRAIRPVRDGNIRDGRGVACCLPIDGLRHGRVRAPGSPALAAAKASESAQDEPAKHD